MIDLNTVVQAIAEHSLKLLRTADSIRIEGSCPAELAKAIEHHAASLLPFAAIDPDSAEQIAEQQAAADSDSIRQQLQDFAASSLGIIGIHSAAHRWPSAVDLQTAVTPTESPRRRQADGKAAETVANTTECRDDTCVFLLRVRSLVCNLGRFRVSLRLSGVTLGAWEDAI